jgi:hypothetical protein
MKVQRANTIAVAALLLAAMSSCAGSGSDPTSSPAPTTTSTTPSPTASPTSASEIATNGASEAVRRYYAVRDQVRKDSKQPLDLLERVAIGTELGTQQSLFKRERNGGLHQTGETKIAVLEVQAVDLNNSDPSAGKVPTVQVDVCFDVSDVDIINADGKSAVSNDRPDTGWQRYIVANYEYDSDPAGAWKVASGEDIERAPCNAS